MVRLERRGEGDSGPVTRTSLHSSPATVIWTHVLLQYLQNVALNIAVNQHQTTLASYFSQSGATGEILHYFKNVYNVEMVFSFSFLGRGWGWEWELEERGSSCTDQFHSVIVNHSAHLD